MAASDRELFFDPRFCGPPGTVNGGFACGALAGERAGATEVTLRRPIPLGRVVTVHDAGDGTPAMLDGDTRLAEARALGAAAVEPGVPAGAASRAAGPARYYDDPAFPGCFVCGPDRAPGDGLRIFPGPVADRSAWTAPWTPDPSVADADGRVRTAVVWAALDCPSGIAAGESAGLPGETTALLGRMGARVTERPRPGRPYRVVAWPVARDGCRITAGSALLDTDGGVLASARTVWITVARPVAGAPA